MKADILSLVQPNGSTMARTNGNTQQVLQGNFFLNFLQANLVQTTTTQSQIVPSLVEMGTDIVEQLTESILDFLNKYKASEQEEEKQEQIKELNLIIQNIFIQLGTSSTQSNEKVDQTLESLADLLDQTVNETPKGHIFLILQTLISQVSPQKLQELSKQVDNLKEILLKDPALNVDPNFLKLLNVLEEKRPRIYLNQNQLNGKSEKTVQSQSENKFPELKLNLESLQSKKTGESAHGEDYGNKFKPFLLRTDTDKILWQGGMDKIQQLALFTQNKGNEFVGSQFLKDLEAVISSSQLFKGVGINKLVIKLFPENLGSVRIEIIQNQQTMVAKMHVENQKVKELIESNLHSLKQTFVSQNLQVDKVEISANADYDPYDRNGNRGSQSQKGESEEQQSQETDSSHEVQSKSFLEEIEKLLRGGGEGNDK